MNLLVFNSFLFINFKMYLGHLCICNEIIKNEIIPGGAVGLENRRSHP